MLSRMGGSPVHRRSNQDCGGDRCGVVNEDALSCTCICHLLAILAVGPTVHCMISPIRQWGNLGNFGDAYTEFAHLARQTSRVVRRHVTGRHARRAAWQPPGSLGNLSQQVDRQHSTRSPMTPVRRHIVNRLTARKDSIQSPCAASLRRVSKVPRRSCESVLCMCIRTAF